MSQEIRTRKFFTTFFFLTLSLLSSLVIITIAIRSIPFLRLPTSLNHVTSQINDLKSYSSASPYQFFHLISILSIIFIWKQTFSIPGTILLNILIGAIYGTFISTFLTCFLTAIGSTCAYQMARSIRPIIQSLFPSPLKIIQRAVDRFKIPGTHNRYDTVELSSYLLIARFLPVVPYAALNLASGVLELPLLPFFWTLVLGSLPYNFLTTQVGDIISKATDSSLLSDTNHPGLSKIWSNTLLLKLALISLIGALPVFFKKQLRDLIQAFVQTLRAETSSPPITKSRFERHQACHEWVSDVGSKRKSSLTILDLLNANHHQSTDPLTTSSNLNYDSSFHAHQDQSDDQSELTRTTSSCSLSTQEEDGSSSATLVINFNPSNPENDSVTNQEAFSSSKTSNTNTISNNSQLSLDKHDYNMTNHHLPLFISKNRQSISNNHNARISSLSIHSLFDLPYGKVGNIVSDNLVLPK